MHLHRKAEARRKAEQRRRAAYGSGVATPLTAATTDIGDIVAMEDSGGIISRVNNFDLHGKILTFAASNLEAAQYKHGIGDGGYDSAAAQAGTLLEDLGDDDFREMALPFEFPFFGSKYNRVFVNSDGNLTFTGPDTNTSERSLGRLTAGPPRIAPLFRDLDPSKALNGVRFFSQPGRVVITWVDVPVYQSFGLGPLQTFQVRLQDDGRIEIVYESITTNTAVVGISPGNLEGETSVITLSEPGEAEYAGTIAERFTQVREIDTVLVAQQFFAGHDDAYDVLVIFNDLDLPAAPGAVAYELTVRNSRTGYGDFIVDVGKEYGSESRLQAVLNMGPLSQYPEDPNAVVPARLISGDTPLTVLAHEAGHLFLAYASIRDPQIPDARPMLGRQLAHWNFAFNSEASLLEGNRICDRERTPELCPAVPSGGRFVTTATVEGYSPLDQYLMGFRPSWDVPDLFLVENTSIFTASRQPQVGVAFDGSRRDIRIDEIVAAEGRRTPDYTVAQRNFRFAFLLIVPEGEEPSQQALDQVDLYRREFEAFYGEASGQRSTADTRLLSSLKLSLYPAAGVVLGHSTQASVSISAPAAGEVAVLLDSLNGGASIPSSVTIPAGEMTAIFQVRGDRAGVDEISAEAAGGGYERATARLQVLAAASEVVLTAVSGAAQTATPGQPLPEAVVVRVTDINALPYPGVTVSATPSGEGIVIPAEAVTGADGQVSFTWAPDAEAGNVLLAQLPHLNGAPSLAVTTTGAPLFTAGGVVNGASFAPGVSPGSFVSVFGFNLAGGNTAVSPSALLPFELAGVTVLFNGNPARLHYVSDTQINFVLPLAAPPGPGTLAVNTPLGQTEEIGIAVSNVSPALFVNQAAGVAAAVVAGSTQLTSERPAVAGDALEIYATGLGNVLPDGGDGLSHTAAETAVAIGGVDAEVTYSGLAPGWIGLYQVNAVVPPGLGAGARPLQLSVDGVLAAEALVVLE